MREGNYFLESITDFQNISSTKMVQSNCMSITFVNKGDTTVTINGLVLQADETIEIGQPNSFIDRTQYQVSFGVGASKNCLVIRILPKNQS